MTEPITKGAQLIMKPKPKYWIIAIFCLLMPLFLSFGCSWKDTFSDAKYVEIAKTTLEAQNFLEMYPKATTEVDRSGRPAVDFRVHPDPSVNRYVRLRVFIDSSTSKPFDMFLECRNQGELTFIKRQDVMDYLAKNTCL